MSNITLRDFAKVYLLGRHNQMKRDGIVPLDVDPWSIIPNQFLDEEVKVQFRQYKKMNKSLSLYWDRILTDAKARRALQAVTITKN